MPVGIYVDYTRKSCLPWRINIKQGTILLINYILDEEMAIFLIALLLIARNVTPGDMEIIRDTLWRLYAENACRIRSRLGREKEIKRMRVEPLGCHTVNTSLSNGQRTSAKEFKTNTQLLNRLAKPYIGIKPGKVLWCMFLLAVSGVDPVQNLAEYKNCLCVLI